MLEKSLLIFFSSLKHGIINDKTAMIFSCHRINTIKQLKKIPKYNGVEIDLRDHNEEIIIQHDPFKKGLKFSTFLSFYHHKFLILNIKSEGIEYKVLKILKFYKIKKYFFLDSSFPMIVNLIKKKEKNIALRFSDLESIETIKNFRYMVDWVWLDCFKKIPLDVKIYKLLRKYKYKICLVSPELHGRRVKNERAINLIKQKKINIDMLCTKIKFFNAWKKRLSL